MLDILYLYNALKNTKCIYIYYLTLFSIGIGIAIICSQQRNKLREVKYFTQSHMTTSECMYTKNSTKHWEILEVYHCSQQIWLLFPLFRLNSSLKAMKVTLNHDTSSAGSPGSSIVLSSWNMRTLDFCAILDRFWRYHLALCPTCFEVQDTHPMRQFLHPPSPSTTGAVIARPDALASA